MAGIVQGFGCPRHATSLLNWSMDLRLSAGILRDKKPFTYSWLKLVDDRRAFVQECMNHGVKVSWGHQRVHVLYVFLVGVGVSTDLRLMTPSCNV
jgi:hypothetical protein